MTDRALCVFLIFKIHASQDPKTPWFHLCIINLVIGTLYCAKGNYEFGISRVIKSLEPYNKKLEADTWYYAKRCFVSLMDMLSKHMIVVPDSTYHEVRTKRCDSASYSIRRFRSDVGICDVVRCS